jgi:hypothetical protein
MPCTEAHYTFLRHFILSRSENTIDLSRDDLFDARLYRLLQVHGMKSLDELVSKLKMAAEPALDQRSSRL